MCGEMQGGRGPASEPPALSLQLALSSGPFQPPAGSPAPGPAGWPLPPGPARLRPRPQRLGLLLPQRAALLHLTSSHGPPGNLSFLFKKVIFFSLFYVGWLMLSLQGASGLQTSPSPRFSASNSYASKDKDPQTRPCRRVNRFLLISEERRGGERNISREHHRLAASRAPPAGQPRVCSLAENPDLPVQRRTLGLPTPHRPGNPPDNRARPRGRVPFRGPAAPPGSPSPR